MGILSTIKSVLGSSDTAHLGASLTAREVQGWEPSTGDADGDNNYELETIRSRARDLDRNSGFARNLKKTKSDNVIGTGLQWQPRINWQVLGRDSDWAHDTGKVAKAIWNDFSNSRFFDADGVNNFSIQSRMMYDSRFTDGSAIAIPMWKERPGTPYRTCFKMIEADRLSNPDEADDTPKISAGVERNDFGEIVAYHVCNVHPGNDRSTQTKTWERIPAYFSSGRTRFIHLYHQDRPGQSRGIAAVSSVMAAFGLRGKYQLTELQAAEVASRIAGVMETPLSDDAAQALFGGEKKDYERLRSKWNGKLTSGMILKLPPGTQYKTHIPNRPATAYTGFMDHISREIGIAVGLPDQLSLRDFTKVNYSSARAALLEAWRGFYVERGEFAFQYCVPCLDLLLEDAVDLGMIDLPDYTKHRTAYTSGKWLGKGHQPIDRLKHENANKVALEIGTTTHQDIFAEDGEDWEDQAEQQLREKANKLRNSYRMKKIEDDLKEEFGFEIEPDPPTPPTDTPESDEEIDKQDEQEEEQVPEQESDVAA